MPVIFVLELMGTIAFAASGALVAIDKKMDVLGVCILGLTTAVGGGIMRDLILGITPPAAFRDPVFAMTGILVSLILFIPSVRKTLQQTGKIYDFLLLVMDSIGLGLFTVAGVQTAYSADPEPNLFLAVFVGVLTGVGGGILRDTFAGNTPFIFVRHFYACASIIGAILCAVLWDSAGSLSAMIAGASVTILLRLLAARYHWSLPRAQ